MKTLLIIDAGLGQARAYMAKTLLGAAAPKAHLELIDNPNDAELVIVLGAALPTDSALNGKQVYLGDINRAVAHPELFLSEAKGHATPYAAPAAAAVPILFAVGVAITPWQELVNAFTLTNLLVIVSTVSALVATGFFVGKKIGMHPIDVAIVSCCQSGQGGTGDVAILTAGNRMSLMPFAQIATRIGGAINVSLGLLFLSHYLA